MTDVSVVRPTRDYLAENAWPFTPNRSLTQRDIQEEMVDLERYVELVLRERQAP